MVVQRLTCKRRLGGRVSDLLEVRSCKLAVMGTKAHQRGVCSSGVGDFPTAKHLSIARQLVAPTECLKYK